MRIRMGKLWALSFLWIWVWNASPLVLFAHSFLVIPKVPNRGSRQGSTVRWATMEQPVDLHPVPVTPCTRICRYNANVFDGNVCIGCFRETFEIGAWETMTPWEKYYTLLDAAERLENVADGETIDEQSTGTSSQELQRQARYWKSIASQTG